MGTLAADPSRVIKVTAAGAVSLLAPAGITFNRPEGVSVDGMGNIYVADGGNNRIVEISTAGVASVLAISGLPTPTTLGTPFGVTVDPFGNLYIPDSGNNRALFVNVSGSALTFTTTAKGSTSAAQTATVTNLGNEPLIFSANPTYTANFSNNANDTNPCTSSTSLSVWNRMRRIGQFHSAIGWQSERRHHGDEQCTQRCRQYPASFCQWDVL